MSLPTRDEIYDEAVKIFMSEYPEAPIPEEDELREGSHWTRARDRLMRGLEGELESALGMYEEEVMKLREALGIAPPLEFVEMEKKVEDATARLERALERLKGTRATIKRYEEEEERRREEERIRRAELPLPPPPPPPVEVGLQPDDEKELRALFLTRLMEGDLSPSRARGHISEFIVWITDARKELKDVPRERAVAGAKSDVEGLAGRILVRVVKPPVVKPLIIPEEAPPVFPVPIFVPIAPPPGLMRRWGMPFALHACPACMGEDKPLEECMQLSSPYLNSRLRRMGVPTSDPLFFKLCDEHRRKYGGAYESFPRYKLEFWVGETVAKAEMDISTMVGMGVSEDYVLYSLAFYDEAKHLAVQ